MSWDICYYYYWIEPFQNARFFYIHLVMENKHMLMCTCTTLNKKLSCVHQNAQLSMISGRQLMLAFHSSDPVVSETQIKPWQVSHWTRPVYRWKQRTTKLWNWSVRAKRRHSLTCGRQTIHPSESKFSLNV